MGTSLQDKPTWRIDVHGHGDKPMLFHIPEDSTYATLHAAIIKRLGKTSDDFAVMFAGRPLVLASDGPKTLSSLGMKDKSILMLALRMDGGIWIVDELRNKENTLVAIPGITITSLASEPDMLSLDDSTDCKRAKMPCGHVIGPASMTQYCKSLLDAGKFKFICPYGGSEGSSGARRVGVAPCGVEWPFALVKHVACLTDEEIQGLEMEASEVALTYSVGFKQCPGCQTWCFQSDTRNNLVRCSVCTKARHSNFDFCIKCGIKHGENRCSSTVCGGLPETIRILNSSESSPDIKIGYVVCPSIRGCPKCQRRLQHRSKCKHMNCPCGYSFCFCCLKPKPKGNWICAPYAANCSPAPRQTSFPNVE